MTKKLSDLEFVKNIDSLCKVSSYSFYMCKKRDNLKDYNEEDEESDISIYYYDPNFHLNYEDSASYYGKKDYHIVYSNYSYTLNDYPDNMISDIEDNYEVVQNLRKTMENLAKSGKFKDIDLMSPRARSLDSDNLVFIIGFNDV